MYKIVYADPGSVPFPAAVDAGGYNDMPRPYRECSHDEYLYRSWHHSPNGIEFRQIHLPGWKTVRNVLVEVYNSFCLAVVKPGQWTTRPRDWTLEGLDSYSICWTEPVLYYYIGCDHAYEDMPAAERPSGMWGCHVKRCGKCGDVLAYSSD